jgi:translation initiation factor IF-2
VGGVVRPQTVSGGPHRRGLRWGRHAAPAWPCPPAWWVGRSLATRPRAVTPGGPPEDAPARGDQHPARSGDRQGPQMHLLAEAQRPASVHSADLRLALPGVPRPRPAVQPRRPAVPGARQRAAGSGAGPVVVGQGDGQAPQCGGRSVAMALLAGAAAGAAWLAPRGGGSTALGKQAPRRWRRVVPTRSGR